MNKTIITGATVWDAAGFGPYSGDILIEGERIRTVSQTPGKLSPDGYQVIDGTGKFLMPGMTEGYAHLSFEAVATDEDLISPPPEEHTLLTARVAKVLLDAGFTSAYGAAESKLRLGVAVRNEVDAGRLPGPRIRAGSLEISVTGGRGDQSRLHNPRTAASIIVDGPEEMRKAVRLCCREGCDNIKLDVSGDPFYPNSPALMTYEEIKMAVDTAHAFGRKVNAHTRSIEGSKNCLRAGVDVLSHVAYSDRELLDMFEEAKSRVFVAPTVGQFHTIANSEASSRAEIGGFTGNYSLVEESKKTHSELRKRGVRHLIGGAYGFKESPNGTNARDLQFFVDHLGYSPEGALVCATRNGGLAMRSEGDLGTIREGSLADLLLVDGDPLKDISIMTDANRIKLIMKGGAIYKSAL